MFYFISCMLLFSLLCLIVISLVVTFIYRITIYSDYGIEAPHLELSMLECMKDFQTNGTRTSKAAEEHIQRARSYHFATG